MPIAKSSSDKLTLFFIRDVMPTQDQKDFADSLPGNVVFRNFNFASVVESENVFVAGMTRDDIPEVYRFHSKKDGTKLKLAPTLEDKWLALEKAAKAKVAAVEETKSNSATTPPASAAVTKG